MNALSDPALKLILDQGVPADSTHLLRALGYECWHISELGRQASEDEEILNLAIERGAVVITLDSDFYALVAVRGLRRPSVVRLRREGCRAEAFVEILRGVRALYHSQLMEGCLISIKEHRATVHKLPVGRSD